jgi:hypothetical protein
MRRLPGKEEKMVSPHQRAVIVGGGIMGAGRKQLA